MTVSFSCTLFSPCPWTQTCRPCAGWGKPRRCAELAAPAAAYWRRHNPRRAWRILETPAGLNIALCGSKHSEAESVFVSVQHRIFIFKVDGRPTVMSGWWGKERERQTWKRKSKRMHGCSRRTEQILDSSNQTLVRTTFKMCSCMMQNWSLSGSWLGHRPANQLSAAYYCQSLRLHVMQPFSSGSTLKLYEHEESEKS